MNVTQINDSWHARSELFPGCSGQGPTRQDAAEQLLLAIEEQFSSGKKKARTRLVSDLSITRTWAEDCEYVERWLPDTLPVQSASVKQSEASLPTVIEAWLKQVASEFDEALPDGGEIDGGSVILIHCVTLRTDPDSVFTAEFKATLDFWHECSIGVGPDDSFTSDHDLIQHIFYEEGFVAGDFKLDAP